jgi:DNA-directed RNA polymerase specialized sigma24 family protein
MGSSEPKLMDEELVEACLAGKSQAWDRVREMIQRISLFRVRGGKYSEEAEEIADQVFFALWRNDCHVLRGFNADRGTLKSYLNAVVKHFSQQAKRIEQTERLRLRKYAAHCVPLPKSGQEEVLRLTLEEFSTRLRGELKRYFQEKHLGVFPKGKPRKYSKTNAWKLEQRLRDEWRRYLSPD